MAERTQPMAPRNRPGDSLPPPHVERTRELRQSDTQQAFSNALRVFPVEQRDLLESRWEDVIHTAQENYRHYFEYHIPSKTRGVADQSTFIDESSLLTALERDMARIMLDIVQNSAMSQLGTGKATGEEPTEESAREASLTSDEHYDEVLIPGMYSELPDVHDEPAHGLHYQDSEVTSPSNPGVDTTERLPVAETLTHSQNLLKRLANSIRNLLR